MDVLLAGLDRLARVPGQAVGSAAFPAPGEWRPAETAPSGPSVSELLSLTCCRLCTDGARALGRSRVLGLADERGQAVVV